MKIFARILICFITLFPASVLAADFASIVKEHRKMLVLLTQATSNDPTSDSIFAARSYYVKKRALIESAVHEAENQSSNAPVNVLLPVSRSFIDFAANSDFLRDGDRLAFIDLVDDLITLEEERGVSAQALMALTLANAEIEAVLDTYRDEYLKTMSQLGMRGADKREDWNQYIAFISSQHDRDELLKGTLEGNSDLYRETFRGKAKLAETRKDNFTPKTPKEVWGNGLPDKTVVLTFDDGPHSSRTGKILDILKQYKVKGYFFSVGKNLVKKKKGRTAKHKTARRILAEGHILANHSYSHAILTKLGPVERQKELATTNELIMELTGSQNILFRPPYGSKDPSLEQLTMNEGMISVMWNVDSMDWADPVPEGIVDRTLRRLDKVGKGILLFHDIHKQTVKALPDILKGLSERGYRVVTLDGRPFDKNLSGIPQVPKEKIASNSLYGKSWAVVIGINEYNHWPRLKYAVNDARSIAKVLNDKLGFAKENIIEIYDDEATRERITEVLGYEMANPNKVKPQDRVFIFYAGHGATREMPSGKNLGYLIPADAELSRFQNRALSMSQINDFSSLIPAKHVYFVMDSCYSGLALTRSGVSVGQTLNYLNQITNRKARQILTAGGADQQVADGGPDGHSIFTWTLLQAMEGLADTDNNGYVTASEIGTYVAPVVASYAEQTPAFGNIIGSQGGDFVFKVDDKAIAGIREKMAAENRLIEQELEALKNDTSANVKRRLELEIARKSVSTSSGNAKNVSAKNDNKADRKKQARRLNASALQYLKEKKYELAEAEWREAVRLNPYNPTLVNNFGFVLDQQNKNEEALKWYYRTVELDARRTSVYLNLGDIMVKLKRYTEAIPYYERYLHLYPSYKNAKELRKKIAQLGDGTYGSSDEKTDDR